MRVHKYTIGPSGRCENCHDHFEGDGLDQAAARHAVDHHHRVVLEEKRCVALDGGPPKTQPDREMR